jgi:alkanesulfonate monooxygenase SsuD/methylene tetrahydromethanopterin reductase-like flavin-dependent oxidoreductase (luciferase family)
MADYGHRLQFGFFLDPTSGQPEFLVDIARMVESLGFDLIGVQDHPYQSRHFDSLALIGFLLGRTDHVRIFPDVASLPLRPPAMLAKHAATLDQMSGGRFELGLGAGAFWNGIRAMGGPMRAPGESLDAMAEAVAIIRAFWRGGTVRLDGPHYRVTGLRPGPLRRMTSASGWAS